MMKLAVGVITYNAQPAGLAMLARSLDVAVAALGSRAEVVLVSVDHGEPAAWPALSLPHEVLPRAGNPGFAGGANRLLAHAFEAIDCDLLVLANPDGAFHPRCLAALLDAHSRYPTDLLEARQFPEEHPKHYDPLDGRTDWASGACMALPRALVRQVGGFDDRFFMYMEDIDLSWRTRAAGFAVRLVRDALFMHDVIRPHDPKRHAMLLLARRQLAHKWHAASFVAQAEAELLRGGLFHHRGELPPLGTPEPHTVRQWQVTGFDHPSHLAPARW